MDKFGIFKLLNSFLTFCQQSNGSFNNTDNENSQKFDLQNALSSLLKNKNENTFAPSDKKQSENDLPKPSTPPRAPLQQSMLSVMQEHDNFIRRVKEKNTVK